MSWALGSTRGKKRIHRPECRYAKMPYNWAGERTEDELVAALLEHGAHHWHDACRICSPELDDKLYFETLRRVAGWDQ